jgi:hypothetical protein
MLLLDHNLWPRFFFFSMGFGLLIVIHGAGQLPRLASRWLTALRMRPRIADLMALGFSSIIIAASLVTVPKNYALPKQSFAAAKNFVEVNASPGDAVVAVNLAGVVYGRYLTPFWPVVTKLQELQPLQESNERLWLVYTLPIEIKAFQPELWRTIERDFKVVRVFPGTLNGGEVFVCQKR